MKSTTKLGAIALSVALVLSIMAPAALAASSAANTDTDDVSVSTGEATNVTNSSAELDGEYEGAGDSESATVSFTYWVEGDQANTSVDTESATSDKNASEFQTTVDGLENNTTYVYVATVEVNGTTYSGEEVTFTTGGESDDGEADAFGQEVSAFVHSLLEERDDSERGIGQQVSEFVRNNNPGADKRPDHAGPPDHVGLNTDADADEDDRRGPPEDKRQGPPEDKGPNADDGEDAESEETEAPEEPEETEEPEDAEGTPTPTTDA